MGAWGYGIFEDDLASDIRMDFEEALAEGKTVPEVTELVLEAYGYLFEDETDGTVVYIALAALQLEQKALQPAIRERVLEIIENEEGMELWEDAGHESWGERKKVLDELKAQILAV